MWVSTPAAAVTCMALVVVTGTVIDATRPRIQGSEPSASLTARDGALTGVATIVVAKGHDASGKAHLYEVRVRNSTHAPLLLGSAVIVVERVIDTSAGRDIIDIAHVLNSDGRTAGGNPFFLIPPDRSTTLGPQGESPPVSVWIRKPPHIRYFNPVFRVRTWSDPAGVPRGRLVERRSEHLWTGTGRVRLAGEIVSEPAVSSTLER